MPARSTRTSVLTATGAAVVLLAAACTSNTANDAASSVTAGVTSSVESGVTAATEPYTGVDPAAAPVGGTDESGADAAGSAAASSAPPAATTAVPQPGGPGNITETVAAGTIVSAAPVALDATSDSGTGVTVALSGIESITTEAELPGEVAGPGVKITVTVSNGSQTAVELGNVVVDLQDAAGTPAIPMTVGSTPFNGSLEPGASATGVYVFSVPATYSNPATITVTYTAGAPVAVFTGDAR